MSVNLSLVNRDQFFNLIFPMNIHFKKSKEDIIPLAYAFYYIPVAFIALIGLIDSIYLAISHYRNYTDIGYQSFCAISKAINCDTVSQSQYSILFDVPVSVWGIMGYALFLFLMTFAWSGIARKKRIWTLLLILSLLFSIYSIILAFISYYYIHSYCIMCILSYAVNLSLLFYVWIIRKRFNCESFFSAIKLDVLYLFKFPRITILAASTFGVIAINMLLAFPQYWLMDSPVLSKNISTGITEEGYPWIGAAYPEIEIIEFSDYLCFQCKKIHYFLRRLIENNPNKIRLIHRHFPMDHIINPLVTETFHSGSARLSILAIYASEKDKFWEMNDFLFDTSRKVDSLRIRNIAEKTGLDFDEMLHIFRDQLLWDILWKDIKEGFEIYHLTGTPGFIINETVYLGQIPAGVLKPYLK